MHYPRLHNWLNRTCWDYYEGWRFDVWPLPEEIRYGIDLFILMTADDRGQIRITNHRSWVGGIKK